MNPLLHLESEIDKVTNIVTRQVPSLMLVPNFPVDNLVPVFTEEQKLMQAYLDRLFEERYQFMFECNNQPDPTHGSKNTASHADADGCSLPLPRLRHEGT